MMRGLIAFVLILLCACAPPRSITVSAAANLQPAFAEIGAAFEKQAGTRIVFNFGATGQLGQQIAQGAPVDLFAAADRATVDDLASRGFIISDTVKIYARGQIVLYTRADSTVQLQSLADLMRPEIKRIAIANPETAPYGAAAREALQNAGVWSAVQSKIVVAENIQQTQQYADTGNVDAAIIARSLAIAAKGHATLIPDEMHKPIDQALGVVKGAKNESDARAFAAFVVSPASRSMLEKYGYQNELSSASALHPSYVFRHDWDSCHWSRASTIPSSDANARQGRHRNVHQLAARSAADRRRLFLVDRPGS